MVFRLSIRLLFCSALLLGGCASYKQNIMLRTPEDFKSTQVTREILQAERNYVIQKNDYLKLEVFTNKGERIIDPNPEVSKQAGVSEGVRPQPLYLVELSGLVKFPVVGELKLEGLTLRQAEAILQTEYNKFFEDCFTLLTFQNKRVIVLGAVGGQVIPLNNQNVSLAEVLAMSKGLANDAKATNIRLVRGEQVFLIDFSTVAGFQAGNMIVAPGDIIYVEPVRRPLAEGLRDYGTLLSLFISTLSLILVVRSLK
jgi:polysaccharide export outer membrane protein